MRNRNTLTRYFVTALMVVLLPIFYALVAAYLVPDGINQDFADRLWKRLFLLLFPAAGGLAGYVYWFQGKRFQFDKAFEPLERADWVLPLLPLMPILQYVISNQEILSPGYSVGIILFFALLSGIFCLAVPLVLSFTAPKYMLMAVSTGFLFILFNMAGVSAQHNWQEQGNFLLQFGYFAAVSGALLGSRLLPRRLVSLVIVFLVAMNTLTAVLNRGNELVEEAPKKADTARTEFALPRELAGKPVSRPASIYFLVYEAYTANETLEHYGYDNSFQTNRLKELGFQVYEGAYSVSTPTINSIARVFSLDLSLPCSRDFITGRNPVKAALKQAGYTTYHIAQSDYMYRNVEDESQIYWDHPFPAGGTDRDAAVFFSRVILQGEFSDDQSLKGVGYDRFLRHKRQVLSQDPELRFLYSHSKVPGHGPSRVGISPDQEEKYQAQYIKELAKANKEMRRDIQTILEHDPGAIIILAGDHGPYLTKSGYGLARGRGSFEKADVDRYDVQDRYGVFLAIRWPDGGNPYGGDVVLLQDVLPAALAWVYQDPEIYRDYRMDRETSNEQVVLGVSVEDGILRGGADDGKPLFRGKAKTKGE